VRYLISAMLVVVAIIHLLPLSGVLSGERLSALYGIPVNEANLTILMRHRAVLFGILGAFLLLAAFRPEYQTLAFVAGFVSVLSFFWLTWSAGNYNPKIARVVAADLVALACLIIGTIAHILTHMRK